MPQRRTRIVMLYRQKDSDGATLQFVARAGDGRHRPWAFISKDRVPDFEGDAATFEIEKVREEGCPWMRWRVVRRVRG